MIRKHFVFTGQVQGVGFRYRARYAAQGLGITGYVSNEWDGSVSMEAQGTQDSINRLLTMINQGSYINIDRIDSKDIPVVEDERDFHVR
ncbi:MAG: acylphosphatase [Butyrivibrio sp.]|nr:acylphosphatase [Butyrivibrio sp.]